MSTLLQIGCNLGDEKIFNLIIENKIKNVYLIDANPKSLAVCKSNITDFLSSKNIDFHLKVIFINCAISNSDEKTLKFYVPHDDRHSAHASLKIEQISDLKSDSIEVDNYKLDSLLDSLNISEVDYLIIDTEGCDKEILSSIMWGKRKIKNLTFEFTHWDGYNRYISPHLNSFLFFLLMQGYKLKKTSALDITASL